MTITYTAVASVPTVSTSGADVILNNAEHPDLGAAARRLGGKYDRDGGWWFEAREEDAVRDLARTLFGSDGSDADGPVATVLVPVTNVTHPRREYRLAGRRLAIRLSQDEPVRLVEGVVLRTGGWPASVTSGRLPDLGDAEPGTVLEVHDLPVAVAHHILTEVDGATVVDTGEYLAGLRVERDRLASDVAAVRTERDRVADRVVARLVEVDAQIAAAQGEGARS